MASITINLSDEQLQKLEQLAQENGVTADNLLRSSIEDWLNYPAILLKHPAMCCKKMLNYTDAWHDTLLELG